jgi:hypothetical protein
MMAATTGDLLVVSVLAVGGFLMAPVAPAVVGELLVAVVLFMTVLDAGKVNLFGRQQMARMAAR